MKHKKLIIPVIVLMMLVIASSCGAERKHAVAIEEINSNIYTGEDYESAVNAIVDEFDKDWNGCTLREIHYGGDEMVEDFSEYADRYDADEVMVLLSSFDVDDSGGDGSLEPNSTYDDWNWILVRSKGGEWKHVDHGY